MYNFPSSVWLQKKKYIFIEQGKTHFVGNHKSSLFSLKFYKCIYTNAAKMVKKG